MAVITPTFQWEGVNCTGKKKFGEADTDVSDCSSACACSTASSKDPSVDRFDLLQNVTSKILLQKEEVHLKSFIQENMRK